MPCLPSAAAAELVHYCLHLIHNALGFLVPLRGTERPDMGRGDDITPFRIFLADHRKQFALRGVQDAQSLLGVIQVDVQPRQLGRELGAATARSGGIFQRFCKQWRSLGKESTNENSQDSPVSEAVK